MLYYDVYLYLLNNVVLYTERHIAYGTSCSLIILLHSAVRSVLYVWKRLVWFHCSEGKQRTKPSNAYDRRIYCIVSLVISLMSQKHSFPSARPGRPPHRFLPSFLSLTHGQPDGWVPRCKMHLEVNVFHMQIRAKKNGCNFRITKYNRPLRFNRSILFIGVFIYINGWKC